MAKTTTKIEWNGQQVFKKTESEVSKNIRRATLLVLGDAVMNSPVDTGRLRNSIDSLTEAFAGLVYTNVDYAPHVELGTENPSYPAQPFLRPALFDNESNIKRIFNSNKL